MKHLLYGPAAKDEVPWLHSNQGYARPVVVGLLADDERVAVKGDLGRNRRRLDSAGPNVSDVDRLAGNNANLITQEEGVYLHAPIMTYLTARFQRFEDVRN